MVSGRALFEGEIDWHVDAEASGLFKDMEEWGNKYVGKALRIAGILHLLEHREPGTVAISGTNVTRAAEIMRRAIEHARSGHGVMHGVGTQSNERYVLGVVVALRDELPEGVITSAMVYEKTRGRVMFKKSAHTLQVLRSLQEHRYLRLLKREGSGPESYVIEMNSSYHPTAKLRNSPGDTHASGGIDSLENDGGNNFAVGWP